MFADVVCGSKKQGENSGWFKCTDGVYLNDVYSSQYRVRGEVDTVPRDVARAPKKRKEKKNNDAAGAAEDQVAEAPQAPIENRPADVMDVMVDADSPVENGDSPAPLHPIAAVQALEHQAEPGPAPKIKQETMSDGQGKEAILNSRIAALEEVKKQSLSDNKVLFRLAQSKKVETAELQARIKLLMAEVENLKENAILKNANGQMTKSLIDEMTALKQENTTPRNTNTQNQIKHLTEEVVALKADLQRQSPKRSLCSRRSYRWKRIPRYFRKTPL